MTSWSEVTERLPHGIELAIADNRVVNENPVIVAFHGWLDNLESLKPLAEAMPQWRWLLVDLSGHGQSSHRSPDSAYHFVEWLHDCDLILRLITRRYGLPIVLGHSLGAALATMLAAATPNRVRALVSLDGLGGLAEQSEQRLRRISQHLEDRFLAVERSRVAEYESLNYMVSLRQRASPLPESIVRQVVARNARQLDSGRWVWRSDARVRMASAFRLTEDFYGDVMRHITAPTLAFFAHNNGILSFPAQAKRLLQVTQGKAQFVEGPHHFHATDPTGTANTIETFLSEI